MEEYIEQGKEFIEKELKFSFKHLETMSMAKRLLKAFTKGFEISKEYWQKNMYSESEKLESFDKGFTAGSNEASTRLLSDLYTEEEVKELSKKAYNFGKIQQAYYIEHHLEDRNTFNIFWFNNKKNNYEKEI